jgi:tetratricopeptide (TPR) repeat protein
MGDLRDEVRALKASAKSARDDQEWDDAIGYLQKAISLMRARMAEAPLPLPSWLAPELADAYGLMGGIEKRWGLLLEGQGRQRHLEASVAAYDEGFKYEKDLQRNKENTYNRVNRLVGRVLLNPSVLAEDGGAVPEMSDELGEAEDILTRQIESVRQKDPWAYCDLGTIRLLRGEPDALFTYRDLDRLRPPAFVYESTLATLDPLRKVAADLRPDLVQAVAQLERSAGHRE